MFNLSLIAQSDTFRVVGYFPNWYDVPAIARQLDYSKLTHIDYAFTNPTNSSGSLEDMGSDLDTVVKYAHAKNVKVLISLGGGDLSSDIINYYSDLLSSSERCSAFVHTIMNFIKKYKLDGIDVDLEGNAIGTNYGSFVQQLSDSIKAKGLLITAAVSGWGDDNIDDATLARFDWINIMSYDATGPWNPDQPGQHSSYEFAQYGIKIWSARGLSKNKLVVGVPFYGHGFNNELDTEGIDYNVIISRFPYAYDQDTVGEIIYYNGVSTIKEKTWLAMEQASGIMIWALTYDTQDTTTSLLNAIGKAMKTYNKNDVPPVVKILSPSTDTTINLNDFLVIASIKDTDGIFKSATCFVNETIFSKTTLPLDTFRLKNFSSGIYTIIVNGIDHQGKTGSDTVIVTVSNTIPRKPYNNKAAEIPGFVQAENYDVGGNNITYHDLSPANEGGQYRYDRVDIEECFDTGGGYNVGWISPGEWMEYSVDVKNSGQYIIEFRVAAISSGLKFSMTVDNSDITGIMKIPDTGDWQNWASVYSNPVHLEKGQHILRLNCIDGDMNFNYFKFTSVLDGIPVISSQSNFTEFPNPVNDFLILNFQNTNDTSVKIEIIDPTGKLVLNNVMKLDQNSSSTINVSGLMTGIYILKVTTGNDCKIMKIFKQ